MLKVVICRPLRLRLLVKSMQAAGQHECNGLLGGSPSGWLSSCSYANLRKIAS